MSSTLINICLLLGTQLDLKLNIDVTDCRGFI